MTQVDLSFDPAYWLEVDLEAEPATWVPAAVRERWQAGGLPPQPDLLDAVVHAVTMVVTTIREEDPPPFMAFLLHPAPDDGPLAAVALRTEGLEEPIDLDQLAAEMRLPEEMLTLPAEERVLDSVAGPVVRMVQRFASPDSPGVETVTETIAYAWMLDDDGHPVVLTLSTAFEDLDDAVRWRNALDELALSVTVTGG